MCDGVPSRTHGETISEYVSLACGRPEHCTFLDCFFFPDLESPATPCEVLIVYSEHRA